MRKSVRLVASHSQVGKALLLTLLLRKDVSFILVILDIIGIVLRIQLHVVLTCTNASKRSRTKPWKSPPLATALPTKATTPTIARTRQTLEANWTCRATIFLRARKGTWSGRDLLRYHQEHQT